MTELTAAAAAPSQREPQPADAAPTAVHGPTLITEQQVRFGTAAAVGMPPATPRKRYPKRYSYLEKSLMSREMDRL